MWGASYGLSILILPYPWPLEEGLAVLFLQQIPSPHRWLNDFESEFIDPKILVLVI